MVQAKHTITAGLALLLVGFLCADVAAQGVLLPSLGPINRSMGGAGTAAPLDAIGANYWNPATTKALNGSELSVGMEMLYTDIELDSAIPGITSGSSSAESGVSPIPQIGWVHHTADPCVTFGVAMVGVGGFKANYPASSTNPVLMPQSNTAGVPGGFGSLYSEANFFQVAPTMSIALSDQLSIGFGPTITMGELIMDPLALAAPDDADGSGQARYPEGRGTRYAWGGGAQVGIYYITPNYWHFGASVKSPQWMEPFRFHSQDENGAPRTEEVKFDLPMIVSLGTAYSGFERWVFAMDVRYFDYKNTDGWGPHGFNADGSLAGLGFSNVMSVSGGAQFEVHEALYVRAGYSFNQSPIRDSEIGYNIGSTLYWQHVISTGFSYYVRPNVSLNFAASYFLEEEKSGPIITPSGSIPGSTINSRMNAVIGSFGVNVRY